MQPIGKVYEAINRVQSALAQHGISKDRKNTQQGYSFRGIDDVYAALSPLLSENKLCILPEHTKTGKTKLGNNAIAVLPDQTEWAPVTRERRAPKPCTHCNGNLLYDGDEWRCLQCGRGSEMEMR